MSNHSEDECGVVDVKLDKVRDYAEELRTWAKTNRESAIATDLLYLIGENP